jgi:hypothetical protein
MLRHRTVFVHRSGVAALSAAVAAGGFVAAGGPPTCQAAPADNTTAAAADANGATSAGAHTAGGGDAKTMMLALVATGAAVALGRRLLQKKATNANGEHYMIDCGSGWTRIERFSVHEGDGLVHLDSSTRLDAAPIAKALASGEGGQREWLQALAKLLDPATPVLIGGTGGVRDGLKSGDISSEQVACFERLVAAELGQRAQFRVIKGEDEALAELESVRYCVGALPSASGNAMDGASMALMSSGGMSSQIVFQDRRGQLQSHSLETKVKNGNSLCLKNGVEEGLKLFAEYLVTVMTTNTDLPSPRSLTGTFVAIEMMAGAGEKAGIAGKMLPVADAQAAIEASLATYRAKATTKAALTDGDTSGWTWKDVVGGTALSNPTSNSFCGVACMCL